MTGNMVFRCGICNIAEPDRWAGHDAESDHGAQRETAVGHHWDGTNHGGLRQTQGTTVFVSMLVGGGQDNDLWRRDHK